MKKWFALIVGLQVLFLVGQMAHYQIRVSSGETLRLRVVPYDPRSLMMGQYMNLQYDISRVNPGKVHGAPQARTDADDLTGRVLYAAMRPGAPAARAEGFWLDRMPPRKPGIVYLQGRIVWGHDAAMNVDYGLERYYIPERRTREAAELEKQLASASRKPVVTAEVAVDSRGRGLIRRVLVDGKPIGY